MLYQVEQTRAKALKQSSTGSRIAKHLLLITLWAIFYFRIKTKLSHKDKIYRELPKIIAIKSTGTADAHKVLNVYLLYDINYSTKLLLMSGCSLKFNIK